MWFQLAAGNGDTRAQKLRDLLGEGVNPSQIARAQELAREWKPKQAYIFDE
jgi:hypothetical protein